MSQSYPHIANTGVVFCMDDRPTLDAAYRRLVDGAEHGHAYSLRFGGAALKLINPDTRDFVLNDLRLMKDALGVTTIILANHLGCAACAAALEESKLEEIAFHTQVLQEAAGYVEQLGLKPVLKLIAVDGSEVELSQTAGAKV